MAMDLATIQVKTAELASFGTTDLANSGTVTAMVRTFKEVNDQMKSLKDEDGRIKSEFKRMAKPYTDEGRGVTCYDFEDGLKMTLVLSGGGMEIDDGALLNALHDMYGEPYGDRSGKAWRAFCAVSDPLDVPRKVNADKLAYEIAKAERVRSGAEPGEVLVTGELVSTVTVEKKPTIAAKVSNMTKAEVKAHDMGELTDVLKVS